MDTIVPGIGSFSSRKAVLLGSDCSHLAREVLDLL
jgi:hypothetical protein